MPLQTSESPQAWPSGTLLWAQPFPGSQESVVHTSPSLQSRGSLTQVPLTQRSLTVQALESAQSAFVVQHAGMPTA